MNLNSIPKENLETKDAITIYNVKVGDKFYYVDCHSRWIDIAEVRKIDIFNGRQRIFVRTFITSWKTGEIIDKRTPQNPYHLWPEDKGLGGYLFRTREEAYQYLIDYVKSDMEMRIDDLKKQAKRHNIQLNPGSSFPQIESRKD